MTDLKTQVETVLEKLTSWENGLAELETELEKARGEESSALGDRSQDRSTRVRRVSDAAALIKVLEADLADHNAKALPLRRISQERLRDAYIALRRQQDEDRANRMRRR